MYWHIHRQSAILCAKRVSVEGLCLAPPRY
jgi:hypothetical protein